MGVGAGYFYDPGGGHQQCSRPFKASSNCAARRVAHVLALLAVLYPDQNVYSFDYPGARLQCDGADEADVLHRMAIAQTTFSSLTNIWSNHRVSRTLKLRTYSLAHASEARTLTDPVMRCVHDPLGFNTDATRNHRQGEPLHGLSRHGPGPAGGPCNAPKGLEQTSKPTDSPPLNPMGSLENLWVHFSPSRSNNILKVECPTVWSTQRQIRPFLHMY